MSLFWGVWRNCLRSIKRHGYVMADLRMKLKHLLLGSQGSGFARLSASFNLRDGLWLDALAGMFWGPGTDALSRLGSRDLVSLRLKVFY